MLELLFPWRKRSLRKPRQIYCQSCDDKGEVVGVIAGMTDGEVTYLTDLFVQEKHRREGRGHALVEKFLSHTEGTTVILLTQQPEFYWRHGFIRTNQAMIRRPE